MIGMRSGAATGDFVDGFNGFIYEFIVYPYHKNEFEIYDSVSTDCDPGCSICQVSRVCLPTDII